MGARQPPTLYLSNETSVARQRHPPRGCEVDGPVAVAALEKHFEARLHEAFGLPLGADLAEPLLDRTADEWEAWAQSHDLPIVAIRN